MWKRLAAQPGGTQLFSAAAMVRVPYFASIVPHVVRMEPGYAEVAVPKWFFVYNHLHTVHAIASCNAAEIAMGMMMEATVQTSHRWIRRTSPRSPTARRSWCPSASSRPSAGPDQSGHRRGSRRHGLLRRLTPLADLFSPPKETRSCGN